MTADGRGGGRVLCARCGERPAVGCDPAVCAVCEREREKARQYAKDHRDRARARRSGPPESVALDADATLSFVAAFQVLDSARARLAALDLHVRLGVDPSLARQLADAAVAMADAYDDALSLLRLVMPGGVLPPRNGPRERVSDEARETLGARARDSARRRPEI